MRVGVGAKEGVSRQRRRPRQGRQAGKGWWEGHAEKGKRRGMEGLRGRQEAKEEGGKREKGKPKQPNDVKFKVLIIIISIVVDVIVASTTLIRIAIGPLIVLPF